MFEYLTKYALSNVLLGVVLTPIGYFTMVDDGVINLLGVAAFMIGCLTLCFGWASLLTYMKFNRANNELIKIHESDAGIRFATEDLEHHTRFIGRTSKDVDISPVALVKRGDVPIEYLELFSERSIHFEEIQKYKKYLFI